ncbi:MAG: YybH family protein [Gemmatimonadota bacterium]
MKQWQRGHRSWITGGGISRHGGAIAVSGLLLGAGCSDRGIPDSGAIPGDSTTDMAQVVSDVEAGVWALHAADTAKDAEAVIDLLWPDYEMLVDGKRIGYAQIVEGSREFMANLTRFHTEWTDLRIVPLGRDVAISSFLFRDSIVTKQGEMIRAGGPTTFVWQRRDGEWRILFGDADHYPVDP